MRQSGWGLTLLHGMTKNTLRETNLNLGEVLEQTFPKVCGEEPQTHVVQPRLEPCPRQPALRRHHTNGTAPRTNRRASRKRHPPSLPAFYTRGPSHWGDLTNRVAEREKRCPMAVGRRRRARPPWSCPSMVVGARREGPSQPLWYCGGLLAARGPPGNI